MWLLANHTKLNWLIEQCCLQWTVWLDFWILEEDLGDVETYHNITKKNTANTSGPVAKYDMKYTTASSEKTKQTN